MSAELWQMFGDTQLLALTMLFSRFFVLNRELMLWRKPRRHSSAYFFLCLVISIDRDCKPR